MGSPYEQRNIGLIYREIAENNRSFIGQLERVRYGLYGALGSAAVLATTHLANDGQVGVIEGSAIISCVASLSLTGSQFMVALANRERLAELEAEEQDQLFER